MACNFRSRSSLKKKKNTERSIFTLCVQQFKKKKTGSQIPPKYPQTGYKTRAISVGKSLSFYNEQDIDQHFKLGLTKSWLRNTFLQKPLSQVDLKSLLGMTRWLSTSQSLLFLQKNGIQSPASRSASSQPPVTPASRHLSPSCGSLGHSHLCVHPHSQVQVHRQIFKFLCQTQNLLKFFFTMSKSRQVWGCSSSRQSICLMCTKALCLLFNMVSKYKIHK